MVKYLCDVKGCTSGLNDPSELTRVTIMKNNGSADTVTAYTYDLCPACYEKFSTMFSNFINSDEETVAPVGCEENSTEEDELNNIFMYIFSYIVDSRRSREKLEYIAFYDRMHEVINYRLVELMQKYYAHVSVEDAAKIHGLSVDFVKNFYTNVTCINKGVDLTKDPVISMGAYVKKYWCPDLPDRFIPKRATIENTSFRWYIFYMTSVIAGYMQGYSYVADTVAVDKYQLMSKAMYVALDNIVLKTTYTVGDMLKCCGEAITLKDMISAMMAARTSVDDSTSFTEKVADGLGLEAEYLNPIVNEYLNTLSDILSYYTNEIRYGNPNDTIPNKYYLYAGTIGDIMAFIK